MSNQCDPDSYPEESKISPMDLEAASVMFPVNKETGNIVDLLTRLMRTENQLVRSQILNMLNDNGVSSPFAKLDDATKLSLLKPRSLQSFDEIASFRQVCLKAIDEFRRVDGTDADDTGTGTSADASGSAADAPGSVADGTGAAAGTAS